MGCRYTLDALHANKTFDLVTGQNSPIIAQLKGNQSTVLAEVQPAAAKAEPLSVV